MSISDYADAPTFTGMTLDRAMAEREDPERVAQLLADPGARAVAASSEGVLLGDGDQPALVRAPVDSDVEPILLGVEDGTGLFATDLDGTHGRRPGCAHRRWRGSRRCARRAPCCRGPRRDSPRI